MQDIIHEIRARFWNLPQEAENRTKAQRNQYMRHYMRDVYWKSHRRVTVTLHPAEYDKIQTSARSSGRNVAAFIREITLASLEGNSVIPKKREKAIWLLTRQLRSVGNNLNQIARHVNRQKKVSYAEIRQAIAIIHDMEKSVMSTLVSPLKPHGD